MWKNKPTGIKILWVWTVGTAAILLTTVSRTRVQDMEKFIEQQDQEQQQQQRQPSSSSSADSFTVGNSFPSDEFIQEDKS